MATVTLGTNANNSIPYALAFKPGLNSGMSQTDVATLQQHILDDQNNLRPVVGGAFSFNGVLYVPNRGYLKILPGDYVGVDNRGWPILLSSDTIANGLWIHS